MAFDPYRILGLQPDATTEQIRKAYHHLARRYHPDVNIDPAAEGAFQAIKLAFEILSSPHKRGLYDAWGELARELDFDAAKIDRHQRLHQPRNTDGLSGILGGSRRVRPSPDREAEPAEVVIPLEIGPGLARRGGEVHFRSPLNGGVLTVNIPPNVAPNSRLRLIGKGHVRQGERRPGDLLLEIRVRPQEAGDD